MAKPVDIQTALSDSNLLGAAFKDRETWKAWFAFLRALFGLRLSADERAVFRDCTERKAPKSGGYTEAWSICGRRAGKSAILALVAVFLTVFRDYRQYLS